MLNKLVRDGKVAVVHTTGYGAGWSSWNTCGYSAALCMDATIAAAVLAGDVDKLLERALELFPDAYIGAIGCLQVAWVPCGSRFYIEEYDGLEFVRMMSDDICMTA